MFLQYNEQLWVSWKFNRTVQCCNFQEKWIKNKNDSNIDNDDDRIKSWGLFITRFYLFNCFVSI